MKILGYDLAPVRQGVELESMTKFIGKAIVAGESFDSEVIEAATLQEAQMLLAETLATVLVGLYGPLGLLMVIDPSTRLNVVPVE